MVELEQVVALVLDDDGERWLGGAARAQVGVAHRHGRGARRLQRDRRRESEGRGACVIHRDADGLLILRQHEDLRRVLAIQDPTATNLGFFSVGKRRPGVTPTPASCRCSAIELPLKSVAIMSGRPSPLRSATATERLWMRRRRSRQPRPGADAPRKIAGALDHVGAGDIKEDHAARGALDDDN
jgi:hypothetical protein